MASTPATGSGADPFAALLAQADALSARQPQGAAPRVPDPDAQFSTVLAQAKQVEQAPPPPSSLKDWGREFGRAAIRQPLAFGGALVTPFLDAFQGARNLTGDALNRMLGRPATPDYAMPSEAYRAFLNRLTGPASTGEKIAESIEPIAMGGGAMRAVGRLPYVTDALRSVLPGANVPRAFIPGVSSNPELAAAQAARAGASPGLTTAQQQAATAGRALGMKLTPGRTTGSVPLQQFEARLEAHPWTSGPFARLASGNQRILNRTVAQAIGESGDTVDATVLSRAADRLAGVFESVRSPTRIVQQDPQATSRALDAIDQQFEGLLPGNASIRANPLVQRLEGLMSGGNANAKQLGQLSSKLGKAAFKQMTSPSGDRDLGQALYGVKDHVDELVQSTLKPEEAAEYAAARGQYRNLMLLTSRTSIVNPSTGNVSGAALATKLQQADRAGFLYGRNQSPMYQAARFAQAFKPIVGDSGTATRSAGHGFLGPLTLGLAGHFTGLPLGEDLALAAAPIAGRIAGNLGSRFYLSRPGAALVRGALALPRATARAGRSLALNPAAWATVANMYPAPRPLADGSTLMPAGPAGSPQVVRGLIGQAR